MASAPSSPKQDENKENQFAVRKQQLSRRHSLAPSKSILKNSIPLGDVDSNNTITIMQKVPFKQRVQPHRAAAERRVSFAPEVTLHKIDTLPELFEPSPKRQPRRRDTIEFIPPVRKNADEFEDQMELESANLRGDPAPAPFAIYQDEDEDEDDENFDGLREDLMELTTHHGVIKVDEIDQMQSIQLEEKQDMDTTDHKATVYAQDMDLTNYHGDVVTPATDIDTQDEQPEEMDFSVHHGQLLTQSEEMEFTAHQARRLSGGQDMDITEYRDSALEHEDSEMDLSQYRGREIPSSYPIAQSTQSQRSEPEMASRQLSHITEVSEPEEDETIKTHQPLPHHDLPKKNPVLEKVQRQANSSFDSSALDEDESSMQDTTPAFGDPSIFEDIMRVTGGSSQEDHAGIDPSVSLTPKKRPASTPRKSLTDESGSPQERSSSLKKRRLSLAIDDAENVHLRSPTQALSESFQGNCSSAGLAEESVLLPSPKGSAETSVDAIENKAPPSMKELIQSLTPTRTKKRESFGYTSQSPRRHSLDVEGTSLTPLHVAKKSNAAAEGLNLAQAVITTTTSIVPLAGNDDSQDMGDITDDYIPVDLKTFLNTAGVKFYDDLNVRVSFDSVKVKHFSETSPSLKDYAISLQKLKQFELFDFCCKELRKNLSEGQELFQSLEKEIVQENPPLIREYFEADPTVKMKMNLQFQILKNFARQQAKSVWYGWRSQLIEGVHQGLLANQKSLADSKAKITAKIDEMMKERSELRVEFDTLKLRFDKLTKHRDEFENCDKQQLLALRSSLIKIFDLCKEKEKLIDSLQGQNDELNQKLSVTTDKIMGLTTEIKQVDAQIRDNQLYTTSDIDDMQLKLKLLQHVSKVQLKEDDHMDGFQLQIGNVIAHHHGTGAVDFIFGTDSEPELIAKGVIGPHLVDKSLDSLGQVSNFIMKYQALKKLAEKLEGLKLGWNGPVKFASDAGANEISVSLKNVINQKCKRLIGFKIVLGSYTDVKVETDSIASQCIKYDDSSLGDEFEDGVEELKVMLKTLKLV